MTSHDLAATVPAFAIVRVSTFDQAELARSGADMLEFQRLHAHQPGYAGTITVDIGPSRSLVVNLWRSEEDANSARENLLGPIDALLGPAMNSSSLIGAGRITDMDIPVVGTPTTHNDQEQL